MLRDTHMRGVNMDQDQFTEMVEDVGGHDTANICKSGGRLYRQVFMDKGQLPKVTTLFPGTSMVEKRPY